MDVRLHLALGVYLFFPDSAAPTVFTSLRLMIKLLLKTVYTSNRSSGSVSVDTRARREGEDEMGSRACPCHAGWKRFIFGECHSQGGEQSHGQEVS